MILKLFRVLAICTAGLALAGMASAAPKCKKANCTHHTIKAAARPFQRLGHYTKAAVVSIGGFSISAFDTAVIDPLGMALQAFADGVDMFVAAPLESLPEPFEAVGDGVHYVYLGVDKVGEILAR